jgi:hydrogenase maturation protease
LPETKSILIYAYGNPGRRDDGLGNALAAALEPWLAGAGMDHVEVDSNFQLNIEDAENIRDREVVVFVDASIEDIGPYHFGRVEPSEGRPEFTLHAASPAYILALCIKLYDRHPSTYLLRIRGYEWDFREGLSPGAAGNLQAALDFLRRKIETGDWN